MTSSFRGGVTGAWTGWIDDGLLPGADDLAHIDPSAFSNRWSPMRRFPESIEPLPQVAGGALERAGVWHPGSTETCSGGVIIGADGGFLKPTVELAANLSDGYSPNVSPRDFIDSLPSTATSLLAKLYGFAEYQANLVHGAGSGIVALSHAIDLLAVGRLDRALVATLSVVPAVDDDSVVRIASAIYLSSSRRDREVELSVDRDGEEPATVHEDEALGSALRRYGKIGALALVHVAMALDRGITRIVVNQ